MTKYKHKRTDTQIHKYKHRYLEEGGGQDANGQIQTPIHKFTNTQTHKYKHRYLEEGGGEDADGQPDHGAGHPGGGQELPLVQVGGKKAERPGKLAKIAE